MNSPDSYDQYADQLLDSVFQNVKQTTKPASALHEDQLFNQLLQNARYSNMSSPPFSNDWLLMQQLQRQQQQMILERQLMSPNNLSPLQSSPLAEFLANIAPTTTLTDSAITETNSNNPNADFTVVDEPAVPPKKIARVPVPSLPDPKPVEEPPVSHMLNANHQPQQLKKKKSFLRSLSSRTVRNQEVSPAEATIAAALIAKTVHHQYKNKKQEKLARKQEQIAKKQEQMTKKQEEQTKKKERAAALIEAKENLPPPAIDRRPSFWKPREEKPKGWWKGQRNQPQQEEYQQEYRHHVEANEDTEEDEEEEELEEEPVVISPPKKSKKQVVVKRVAVSPKKVSSLKVTQPKRPMAFKTPTRKNKVSGKKSSNSKEKTDDASTATQPVYVMPQQMYQQPYYQQPMMMVPPQQSYGMMPGGNGYYCMPNMPNMMVPQPQAYKKEEEAPQVRRNKSVYNPRETSNDKCTIM